MVGLSEMPDPGAGRGSFGMPDRSSPPHLPLALPLPRAASPLRNCTNSGRVELPIPPGIQHQEETMLRKITTAALPVLAGAIAGLALAQVSSAVPRKRR